MVGIHGRTGIRKVVLGSVAEDVFRYASCPVLTIGLHSWQSDPQSVHLKHVLFPTDLSVDSVRVLPVALAIATKFNATVYVGAYHLTAVVTERVSVPDHHRIRSFLQRYGTALFAVVVGFVATLLVQGLFPYPFLFLFFGAVMASAWFGGTGPGLFAVLLSTVVVEYFFVPPFHSFAISTSAEAYFAAFVVCALVASWVSSAKKKSEVALKQGLDQLEIRVSERSAELMKTQTELAHLSQVLSMGELTASIAHEINQPLTAVVTHGHACIEWLSANPPNLEKTRQTIERIIQDGTRAGAVLGRIRALFKKEAPAKDWFDMNEVIHELTVFLRDEATRRRISIRTDLVPGLSKVKADRVQLQQVVLNLMMNGMDAVAETAGRPKELLVSAREEESELIVRVEDSGVGLDAETAERIFNPFFTTKPHGSGMGLSISRSIVESHEGHLWAVPRPSGGAIFQFTLPIRPKESDD